MNLNENATIDQLGNLIREGDDSAGDHVLWVKKSGEVELSRIPHGQNPDGFEEAHPDMQMRVETFLAGNEYVGPEAADDSEWVTELFERLVREWPKAKAQREVAYIGEF